MTFARGWRRWVLGAALCAAQITRSLGVQAQEPPQAAVPAPAPTLANTLTGQAKADYEAARILFGDQDYAGAFVKFQQSFSNSGDVRLLWNMAVCEKNLRHYGSVLALLERYKREGSAKMTEAHLREVDDVLQTVRTLISKVHVAVNEPGASIYVDDRVVGTTPLSGPLLIDLGKHRLRIAKPGFVEQSVVQDFGGGSSMTFRFSLTRMKSEARLTISAEGMISLDGKPLGDRYWSGSVPAGEHAVRVTAAGMVPYERELVLEAGQSRTLNIALSPTKSGIPAAVWVGAGVLAAGGLAVGGYFLFRGDTAHSQNITAGTLSPGTLQL